MGAYAKQVADAAAERYAAAKETVVNSRELCEDYVKREPVKAALIAAAVGAIATKVLLMALTSMTGRRPQGQAQRQLPYRY